MDKLSQKVRRSRNLTLLSIVVPCFNEEQVIRQAHRSLTETLETIPEGNFELIYVDDGSNDGTLGILRELQQANQIVRIIVLSRNFGHQVAVTAGLEHAAGNAIVVIDADLQDQG